MHGAIGVLGLPAPQRVGKVQRQGMSIKTQGRLSVKGKDWRYFQISFLVLCCLWALCVPRRPFGLEFGRRHSCKSCQVLTFAANTALSPYLTNRLERGRVKATAVTTAQPLMSPRKRRAARQVDK